jgi:glycosyltransferase involved in cell wall biosynthesis
MIKVLIFAYDFPPYNSIGGQRPYSWYKYFSQFGIHPIVVTRHWDVPIKKATDFIIPSINQNVEITEEDNGTIIRVPNLLTKRNALLLKHGMEGRKLQRKALSLYHDIFQFIWPSADLKYQMYIEARKYILANKVDLILPTAEPWVFHAYGHKLYKEFNIPWIADYRDGWTANQANVKRSLLNKIRYAFFRRFERKFSSNAAVITTASPSYTEDLRTQIKIKHTFKTIYNGYDNEHFENVEGIQQSKEVFELAYAGRFYDYQNWQMFLSGFKKFIDQNGDQVKTRIIFYGIDFYPDQKQELLNYMPELSKYIYTTERMPYPDVIRKLKQANILLLFSKKNTNWLSAKLFDYLPLNRKILLVENDNGILEKIIKECNGGVCLSSDTEVACTLQKFYEEWLSHQKVQQHTINYEHYSRAYQAKEMVDLIKTCIKKSN